VNPGIATTPLLRYLVALSSTWHEWNEMEKAPSPWNEGDIKEVAGSSHW